jgi:hypothetical protein
MILELSRICGIVAPLMILELFHRCGIVASFMILELFRKCGIVDLTCGTVLKSERGHNTTPAERL